jgi:hypothetical protein
MMNQANDSHDRIKIGLGIALLAALTGCVGYVDGGYYGGPVVVPGPTVYFWGGDYDRGRDVHVYSQRGYESRAVVHPVVVQPHRGPAQSHPTPPPSAHSGGGGHGGKQ